LQPDFPCLCPEIVLVLRSLSRSPSEHQPENEEREREQFLTKRGETRPQLLEQKHFVDCAGWIVDRPSITQAASFCTRPEL
jgi:hypothetical protein